MSLRGPKTTECELAHRYLFKQQKPYSSFWPSGFTGCLGNRCPLIRRGWLDTFEPKSIQKACRQKASLRTRPLPLQTGEKTRAGTVLDPLLFTRPLIKICKAPCHTHGLLFSHRFRPKLFADERWTWILVSNVFALGMEAGTGPVAKALCSMGVQPGRRQRPNILKLLSLYQQSQTIQILQNINVILVH